MVLVPEELVSVTFSATGVFAETFNRMVRLFEQLERQFELAEERHPERVERIEAIEEQIGELLPFDEECFDGDHGEEDEGDDAEDAEPGAEGDQGGDATT